MPHYGNGTATAESIRQATRNALDKADELGCQSLAIPILGTGAAGFGFEEGAQLVCGAIRECEPSSLTDVRVIAYSPEEYETVRSLTES